MNKVIKIKFVDFYSGFDKEHNEFIDVLSECYNVVQCDDPDYIIYSGFGNDHLKYDCIRIFFTGECITPDFNECDYAIGFDRLTFGDRYARIPLYNIFQYKKEYQKLKLRKPHTIEDVKGRGFCSFVVSNCFSKDRRDIFFEQLSKYKKVASGGRYKNNIGGAIKDKNEFLKQYKFNIAFENCSYDGYATEKIMEAFAAGVIPIYYGDPRIAEDFNPKAFINANNYPNFASVIERVKQIDNDDKLYIDMLNEPIIQPNANVVELKDFLLSIFERSLLEAVRRPHSQAALGLAEAKQRHEFYEKYVYRYYRKALNQFIRIRKGVLLNSKRTK